jgi:hypothetical protein
LGVLGEELSNLDDLQDQLVDHLDHLNHRDHLGQEVSFPEVAFRLPLEEALDQEAFQVHQDVHQEEDLLKDRQDQVVFCLAWLAF